MQKKILVLGLGSTILCDDGAGPCVIRQAMKELAHLADRVEFREIYTQSIDLLYEITGYEKVLIVDSIVTGMHPPGTVMHISNNVLGQGQEQVVDSHSVNIATIVKLGNRYGYDMPEEFRLIGIEAEDVTTFSEKLSDSVAKGIDEAVREISKAIEIWENN